MQRVYHANVDRVHMYEGELELKSRPRVNFRGEIRKSKLVEMVMLAPAASTPCECPFSPAETREQPTEFPIAGEYLRTSASKNNLQV